MKLETMDLFKQQLSKQKELVELSETDLHELQKIELGILKDVKFVCEKYDILCFLGGGTALGAYRHHGFIPWDDDVDININAAQIPLVIKKMQEHFPGKYTYEIPGITEGYLSFFVQIHKRGTVFMEDSYGDPEKKGIKIDIFPIENTYNNRLLRWFHGMGCMGWMFLFSCYRMKLHKKELLQVSHGLDELQKSIRVKAVIGNLIAIAPDFMWKRALKWISKCKNTKSRYVSIPSGRRHFFGELYERKTFCKPVKAKFECETCYITADYKNYLTRLYGEDYMILPEESKREKHLLYRVDFGNNNGEKSNS